MRVPNKAPTKDTSPPKTGIELAMRNAIMVLVAVHENQAIQWKGVLDVRCFDPFRRRTKQYFAGNCPAC